MAKKTAYRRIRPYIPTFVIALLLLLLDLIFFRGTPWLGPLVVLSVAVASAPYWIKFFLTLQRQSEIESRFPEFVRNLSGSIKSGMPAPRAIMHISKIDYGALSPHVKKLANQIEWAIPVHKALLNFANETRNAVIKRAVSSVIEAEMSGGNIEDVLESVTESVVEIKKLKQKRRAAADAQIIQSYVIFAVFLVVMIIIQNLLVPYIQSLEQTGGLQGAFNPAGIALNGGLGGLTMKVSIDTTSLLGFIGTLGKWFVSLHGIFLMVAVIQALFAGLVVGKLAEGSAVYGIKHSLIMVVFSIVVILLTQGYVG